MRWPSRTASISLAGLALVTLLLGGSAAWLLGSEFALQWGARLAERLSDGRLRVQGVQGTLAGPLRIGRVRYQSDEMRYELTGAELDWRPAALLERRLHLQRLTVATLRLVELRPNSEPLQMPETLKLPLTLNAPAVRVAQFEYRSGDASYGLDDIELGVTSQAGEYRLTLHRAASDWGHGKGTLALGDRKPYAVAGRLAVLRQGDVAYQADLEAAGNLARLRVTARAQGLGGRAELQANLRPFEVFPLGDTRIQASGIDPARLREDLPKASLDAELTILRQGAAGLEGRISIHNAKPGSWDSARLPLAAMTASFNGDMDQLVLRDLLLDLGPAGRFDGSGEIVGQRLALSLASRRFDPHGLHGRLHAMRLAGKIRLQADAASQQLQADLRDARYRLQLDASHQAGWLDLRQVAIRSLGGNLAIRGRMDLRREQAFQLTGALEKFDPSDFGDYPAARINATVTADGRLAGTPQVALKFAIADSQLRRQPLAGQGVLQATAERIWEADATLRLAHNRLDLKGALGRPGDRLAFRLDAGNLALIDPRLGGKLKAEGRLAGRFAAISGTASVQGAHLSWGEQYRVADIRAQVRLEEGIDGPLEMEARLERLATPAFGIREAGLNAHGTRGRHSLEITARHANLDFEARLAGGWRDAEGWSGQLLALRNRGLYPLQLQSPAALALAPQRLQLGAARLEFLGADLALQELDYHAGKLASKGEVSGLPLAGVQRLAGLPAAAKTDMVVAGSWQFHLQDTLNGQVTLRRERGDMQLPGAQDAALGLQRLNLQAEAVDSLVQLRLEAAGTHLGEVRAEFNGRLANDPAGWAVAGAMRSRGTFGRLPFATVQRLWPDSAELKTDLLLGGDWELALHDALDGHVALQRESGDVTLPTLPRTTLGLQQLQAQVTLSDGRAQGRVDASGTRLGRLHAEAQSRLTRRDGVWGLAGDAPLQASADLAIASLAWLSPFLDRHGGLLLDGALDANLRAVGSIERPRLAGTLSGQRLSVTLPQQGVRLEDGRLQARLQEQTLLLDTLTLRGGQGSLRAQGQLALEDAASALQLTFTADKLELLSRPDRLLVLSGSGDIKADAKKARVTARLKADRGLIELADDDAPVVSDDVVVLGQPESQESRRAPYGLSFDLDLDLGSQFTVKGQGLDAQIGGALKLSGKDSGLPTSRGSLRIVKGSYSAYGQRLQIERGILNFQGPVDNPGLNIVALRKNQPVEAGVSVTGTAQAPVVKLVSTPSVPDSEKLSWLVLGHGIEDSSSKEFSVLQAAAGALLAAGESVSLQQRIAHAAGLEEVSLKGGGGLENSVLLLGKRISSRVYLNYEQGLAGAGSLVRINYTLTRRLSLRAEAGTASAVDLFYTFSFD